ncbi:Parkin coregulated protein [Paragonimus heterotremus]|uniref:Parkin coregulated protein n=1 Tax=Paragonimus heterotremus TaxID=100268 RepID=A0A8J4TKQ3_9TREM|nr:Parkin coregulated protein [Paragonimus heterotremus]
MPRRYPFLGTEDPQPIKAKRPFTIKSEQEIWDLGSPTREPKFKPMKQSQFQLGMRSSKYPFIPDHSAPMMVPRLAWMNEIQTLDYAVLLPDLFEGLTDMDIPYATMAMTALTDIFKHGPVEKLIDALPTMTIALKQGLSLNNLEVNRRIIEALRRMCIVQPGVGPDLAFYMREILVPLNYYFERTKYNRDQIIYKESIHADIYDAIDQLVKLFLQIAGPELETAERNIKKAIPTYQINSDF